MINTPITTHILDTSLGTPARGVDVALEVSDGEDRWTMLARGRTDGDGRIGAFEPPVGPPRPGLYRLRFATGAYFAARGVATFYPEVSVVVRLDDPAQHYHIPLLLSPFGYSTYRGS